MTKNSRTSIKLNGLNLTVDDVVEIARSRTGIQLSPEALARVERGRKMVERILSSGRTAYGINTGFGKLADVRIDTKELEQLQTNLIRSHSVGSGTPLSEDQVRAIMVVRLNSLLRGNSGVRPIVLRQLKELLNNGFYPEIPRHGSLGASGDLAPSAHLALTMMGEGHAFVGGKRVAARRVLSHLGVPPIRLKEKEGLAIINGTQVMAGLGCLIVHDCELLLENLGIAGALSLEALGGNMEPFDPRIQALRSFRGQAQVASQIRELTKGSRLVGSVKRVQDAYSLRCIPQVHGAFMDALTFGRSSFEKEVNSVTDNPILFPEDDLVLNSGNFHGQPLAIALDLLGVVMAEASVFSERRIDKLLTSYNPNLPPFLSPQSGLNSGLMVTQYTAAALISQNKILARPAGLDSPTVSAGQEDHSSMGVTSALKAREILENTTRVIAIEMMCAAQAIDLYAPLAGKESDDEASWQAHQLLGRGTTRAYLGVRKVTKKVEEDRPLSEDIERVAVALSQGAIANSVKSQS